MMKPLLTVLVGLTCGAVFAYEPMPAWDRVEGKPIPFFRERGFAFEVDDSMARHYEEPTVEVSLIVPPRFISGEVEYEFYSVLFLSKELSADLDSHPHDKKRRTLLTISEELARKSQVVFYFKNRTETATEGTMFVLDLGGVLDDWKRQRAARPVPPGGGALAQYFRRRAEEARIGAATAGLNEAKASLSVAFAKAYLRKANAGGDGAAITAAEVMAAAGFRERQTFGDVVVVMRSAGRTVTLTAISLAAEAIPEGKQPTGTWTVPEAK